MLSQKDVAVVDRKLPAACYSWLYFFQLTVSKHANLKTLLHMLEKLAQRSLTFTYTTNFLPIEIFAAEKVRL